MLHGSLKADDETIEVPEFRVSYKPQKISPKFPGSVRLPSVYPCIGAPCCTESHAFQHLLENGITAVWSLRDP